MNLNDQNKILNDGFTILRRADYPAPMIKIRQKANESWRIWKKFETKAARDRAIKEELLDPFTVED